MKTILLMRHAEAADAGTGQRDFDRALTTAGERMAAETGKLLRLPGLAVDRIIASAAVRTQQTAQVVAKQLNPSLPIDRCEELYNASSERFATAAAEFAYEDESTVLVVGHNPGMAALMCHWAGQSLGVSPATLTIFRTTALSWSELRANSSEKISLLGLLQDGRVTRLDASLRADTIH